MVPAPYNTEYAPSSYEPSKTPHVLEFLKDTGDKATWIIKNAGDKTLWFLKNKINNKVKAIRNILPEIPSGYSVPSYSYGIPVVSYKDSVPNRDLPSTSHESPNFNTFIPTATLKSTSDPDTVINILQGFNM